MSFVIKKDDIILVVGLVKLLRLRVRVPPILVGDGISFVRTVMLQVNLEQL